jgi:hypothetical protein
MIEKATTIYGDKVKYFTVELSILWNSVDHVCDPTSRQKEGRPQHSVDKNFLNYVENFGKIHMSSVKFCPDPDPLTT